MNIDEDGLNLTKEKIKKKRPNYKKIPHPDYGYVEFHGITKRQEEILEDYMRLIKQK